MKENIRKQHFSTCWSKKRNLIFFADITFRGRAFLIFFAEETFADLGEIREIRESFCPQKFLRLKYFRVSFFVGEKQDVKTCKHE